jgi:hypothetical protein
MNIRVFGTFLQDRREDWDGYRHLGQQYARWSVTTSVVLIWTGAVDECLDIVSQMVGTSDHLHKLDDGSSELCVSNPHERLGEQNKVRPAAQRVMLLSIRGSGTPVPLLDAGNHFFSVATLRGLRFKVKAQQDASARPIE